jgi:hypothetical protein
MTDVCQCPFCDFAAIVDDPQEPRFECEMPGCRKTSCLECGVLWHHGMTCAGNTQRPSFLIVEYRANNRADWRIRIEEERTKAVLRYCKRCGYGPFQKENGCNTIKCPKCRYKHCFICGKPVATYSEHFGKDKCPLFDDTQARLASEATRAEVRMIRRLLGEARPEWRMRVEESMTKAVLRYCTRCGYGPFMKDNNCNSIKCPKCRFKHCFICGEHVRPSGDHFGPGKCPMFDDINARLESEAARAEERAFRSVLRETLPEINAGESDVEMQHIKVQERLDDVEQNATDLERTNSPTPQYRPLRAFLYPFRSRETPILIIQVILISTILFLTIALLHTRPPHGTDRALFIVILLTNALSLLGIVALLTIVWSNNDNLYRLCTSTLLFSMSTIFLYFGEAIAFAVKLGRPFSCGDYDYILSNKLIAGSLLRCNMAKADSGLLWFGKPNNIFFSQD